VRNELGRREEAQACFDKVKELEDTGNNIPILLLTIFLTRIPYNHFQIAAHSCDNTSACINTF
jgi:hypothetical protein